MPLRPINIHGPNGGPNADSPQGAQYDAKSGWWDAPKDNPPQPTSDDD